MVRWQREQLPPVLGASIEEACKTGTTEVGAVLSIFCEEIFEEQLASWYSDTSTWPENRSFEVFSQWFDFQHHSMLVDLCDEPLIHD